MKILMRIIAVLLLSAAGLALAETGEFGPLIDKKGPAVREILDRPTLYREAKMPGLPCGSGDFGFLLDRPRLSMAIARLMDPGLDEYRIESRPDGSVHVDDQGRLVGDMEVVLRQEGKRVYYISGYWKFLLGVKFTGRMVLVPEYADRPGAGGRITDATARGYMKVDNALAGFVARAVVYIFPAKVDARMERFADAVRKATQAVHDDPAGVYRSLVINRNVPPEEAEEFRERFVGKKAASVMLPGGGA